MMAWKFLCVFKFFLFLLESQFNLHNMLLFFIVNLFDCASEIDCSYFWLWLSSYDLIFFNHVTSLLLMTPVIIILFQFLIILSVAYSAREHRWRCSGWRQATDIDELCAYLFTGIRPVFVLVLGSFNILHVSWSFRTGTDMRY